MRVSEIRVNQGLGVFQKVSVPHVLKNEIKLLKPLAIIQNWIQRIFRRTKSSVHKGIGIDYMA